MHFEMLERGKEHGLKSFPVFQIRSDVESKAGGSFEKFLAVNFASQVVAGVNYFIKVRS